jgi:hypothetical protein
MEKRLAIDKTLSILAAKGLIGDLKRFMRTGYEHHIYYQLYGIF